MLAKYQLIIQITEKLDNLNIYPYTKKRNSREQGTRKYTVLQSYETVLVIV